MAVTALPWFAERDGDFVLFRVNRRPRFADSLLPAELPDDVFDHFRRVLAPGWQVVTGRKNQRTWRIGGVETDEDAQLLTAKLGYVPLDQEVVPQWDEQEMDWIATVSESHKGQILPMGFDGETRLLAVLRDSSTQPDTIGGVVERVLRENEQELDEPTTDWSVEPLLDEKDFLSWLESVDVVRTVSFNAKLPNPEPRESFRDLFERMNRRHATSFSEKFHSDREEGLVEIEEDPDFRQAVQMGRQGFAELSGDGQVGASTSRFRQKQKVASEHVEALPADWPSMRQLLKDLLRARLRRFLEEDDSS